MEVRDDAMVPRPDLEVLKAAVETAGEAIVITSADLDELAPSSSTSTRPSRA